MILECFWFIFLLALGATPSSLSAPRICMKNKGTVSSFVKVP